VSHNAHIVRHSGGDDTHTHTMNGARLKIDTLLCVCSRSSPRNRWRHYTLKRGAVGVRERKRERKIESERETLFERGNTRWSLSVTRQCHTLDPWLWSNKISSSLALSLARSLALSK
jgi:hypothetical protein